MGPLEIFIGNFIGVLFVALVFLGASSVVFWRLIDKLGFTGWHYLIPAYNSYVFGRAAGQSVLGILAAVAQGITMVIPIIAAYTVSPLILGVMGLFSGIVLLVYVVFWFIIIFSFAKKFDAGFGKWLVLLFIPLVGMFLVDKVSLKSAAQTPPPQTPTTTPTAPATNTPQTV